MYGQTVRIAKTVVTAVSAANQVLQKERNDRKRVKKHLQRMKKAANKM